MTAIITVGKACVKLNGKDAGKKAVIIKVPQKLEGSNKVEVLTEEGKKSKANIRHLWPLPITLKATEEKELLKELRGIKLQGAVK